jgi:leucyl/phenylalanyl-tRNA---protein transferase
VIPWLDRHTPFPSPERALKHPNGLLAAGGDLSPERLLAAYRHGIFPWFSEDDPLLWWSPDPRMVLYPKELKVSRSLAKSIRNRGYEVRIDSAFKQVLEGCAGPRPEQPGTWLGPEMRTAYVRLHKLGFAHSIETWFEGRMVGGLYGMAIGRMFYGESMFSRMTDASKVALVALVSELLARDFPLIDCQMNTRHLASLGAREIMRSEFLREVAALVNYDAPPGVWQFTSSTKARLNEDQCQD